MDEHRSITGATMRGGETRPPPAAAKEPGAAAAVVNLEAGSCGATAAAAGDEPIVREKKSVTVRCVVGDCAAMLLAALGLSVSRRARVELRFARGNLATGKARIQI